MTEYDPRLDGERGYYAARRFQRIEGLIAGDFEPINDAERELAARKREAAE